MLQRELLHPVTNILLLPVPELGLVVDGVAVHRRRVRLHVIPQLEGDGVRGLGGQDDQRRRRRPVDNQRVGDHVLAKLVVHHALVGAGVLLGEVRDLEAAVGQLAHALRLDKILLVHLPGNVGHGGADGNAGHLDLPPGSHCEGLLKGGNLGRNAGAGRNVGLGGRGALADGSVRGDPELVAALLVQAGDVVVHLKRVDLVALGGEVARAVNLPNVDGVVEDLAVGLLRVLPADKDGVLGHGQRLDGAGCPGDILLRGGRNEGAPGSVSAISEGQHLHRMKDVQYGTGAKRNVNDAKIL